VHCVGMVFNKMQQHALESQWVVLLNLSVNDVAFSFIVMIF
jgi:hypothetical protein